MEVRTRIAPSPTGFPHIGTIYQALFNYAFAHKNGGKFIVRVEDTDRARFVEGAEEAIYRALDWFGLTENESPRKSGAFGPYKQSERLELYHKYTQDLIDRGYAEFVYYSKADSGKKDYTNKEEVVAEKVSISDAPGSVSEMITNTDMFADWVVKMKIPKDQKIIVEDQIRGRIEFDTNEVSAQVLLKSDGFPTYHLAVVVDDHLMEISHIVRAEEWLSSFPKHKILYDYFGWTMPPVFHTATLRNPDKSKLSKRHSHTNVDWYREAGFLPEAILNFLGLLGWSHPEEKEIFDLDEFTSLFELKDIRPAPPVFDLKKLEWMNGVYIREKVSTEKLEALLRDFYKNDKSVLDILDDTIAKVSILNLAKTRMNTLAEFKMLVTLDTSSDEEGSSELKTELTKEFESLSNWNKDEIFGVFKKIMETRSIKMPIMYKIFTGRVQGLPLPDFLEALGREKTLARIK